MYIHGKISKIVAAFFSEFLFSRSLRIMFLSPICLAIGAWKMMRPRVTTVAIQATKFGYVCYLCVIHFYGFVILHWVPVMVISNLKH